MSRRRQLSEEERALWTGFARSIAPLRPRGKPTKPSAGRSETAPVPSFSAASSHFATRHESPSVKGPPPLAPFGRRLRQRVGRGRESIDARLDLHGMTQRQAHAALLSFIRRAQAEGAKIVLIVTGKGSRGEGETQSERGVLRRQVPLWLALPELRPFVVGFEDAKAGHGGQGALYVRLRRGG